MLTRLLRVAAVAALLVAIPAGSVLAAPNVICDLFQTCWVDAETPGLPGTGDGSEDGDTGSDRVCADLQGRVVPCYSDAFGWFNDADRCYYELVEPQPPADALAWEGHYPDGSVWSASCVDIIPGSDGGWTWLPSPPSGYGDTGVTAAQLAQRAVNSMRLTGPAIGLSIESGDTGLVGVPLWLWTQVTPTTWGPNSATASVPGMSVTARAQATRIVWDMGDGHSVTCEGPGTEWTPGAVESPTCDHTYEMSSAGQPGDAYEVTATATWAVTWSGGGTSGSLTVTRTSTTSVRIGELQVLVTG